MAMIKKNSANEAKHNHKKTNHTIKQGNKEKNMKVNKKTCKVGLKGIRFLLYK